MTDRPAAPMRARQAEARRNRETLVQTAGRLFAESPVPVTFDAVARAAGVGIGTLYRHFPTREALVEAVTVDQMAALGRTADEALASDRADVALDHWMTAFVGWARAKTGMLDTLAALMASGRIEPDSLRGGLVDAIDRFLAAGAADGSLRQDVAAADVAALVAGALRTVESGADLDRLPRLLGLVVDGLRTSATP